MLIYSALELQEVLFPPILMSVFVLALKAITSSYWFQSVCLDNGELYLLIYTNYSQISEWTYSAEITHASCFHSSVIAEINSKTGVGFRLGGVWSVWDCTETQSGIHWDPRWSSKCHVRTWPLDQTYWSAWLLAVQTHRGQINSAGGDWPRQAETVADGEQISARRSGANVKGRVFCDVSRLASVDTDVMCSQVNNSTRLQQWVVCSFCLSPLKSAIQHVVYAED